ncbi:MAG: hypothetical protein JW760_06840 [Spirochaetales bacterium]|nr:hypothetical protein [Spirochaetales bacterium]
MKFDTESRNTIAFYIAFLIIILAAVAFAGRFVLFRPWTSRTHSAAAVFNDRIYLFGGQHRSGSPLKDILVIHPEEGTLKRAGKLPEALMFPAAAALGQYIYIAGGYKSRDYSSALYRYNPVKEECVFFTELPYPAAFGCLVPYKDRLYYLGGWDGKELRRDILVINPSDGRVTAAGLLPVPLQYANAAAFGDGIYIFGGEDNEGISRLEVYRFAPETESVSLAGSLKMPLQRAAAATMGDFLYLGGGWSTGITDRIVCLHFLERGEFSVITAGKLPEAAADLTAAALDGRVFFFGGTDPTMKRQIRVVRYDPSSGMTEDLLLRSFAWW